MADTHVSASPGLASWVHTGYAQQIVFGDGALHQLTDILKLVGLRRVLLVTTEGRAASDEGEQVVTAIGRVLESTFSEVTSHAPTPMVQAAVRQARRDGIDGIVSFGGGSCADTGKAVCFFTEQERGTPGASFADRPVLPHISIPTTYSGAELTPFFGMTDPATRQKSGAGGPTIAPIAAIYDPRLTLSTPPRVSAETGMNALGHCVEAVWSPFRTPEAEAIALSGATRIFDALPRVVDNPVDLSARADMLAGAVLAGRALHNATMGLHHGLAQLVGGRTAIPHGLANAIILSHVIDFNVEVVPNEVRRLGQAIGAPDDPAGAIRDLVARLGLPATLSEAGVDDDDLDAVARLSQSNFSVRTNPRPVSEEDARAVLEAAS
jgi:maleylacetate reductase